MDIPPKKKGKQKNETLIQKRKEEILQTATTIFAQKGFRKTDVQEIADALSLAKGTVYRYFPSKRELFLSTVDRGMILLNQEINKAAKKKEDPLEKIESGITAYLSFFESNPHLVELFIQERAEFKDRKKPTYFEHREINIKPWKKLFKKLVAEKKVRDLPIDKIMDAISDLLYGTIFINYFSPQNRSLKEQSKVIIDLIFFGILDEKEQKRRRKKC